MVKKARVLVTGINGFVGKHLARELASRSVDVFGCGHEVVSHSEISDICGDGYQPCDLSEPTQVAGLALDGIDAVINLAGLASMGASRENPAEYLRVNVAVHKVLCEELLKRGANPRYVAVSTGTVYSPDQPLPQSEASALVDDAKTAPYVVSKKLMEFALQEYKKMGQDIVVARPFNHIGPGQRTGFLIPDLAEQIMASDDNDCVLRVGNLNTRRDYTDVRDVVKAYADLALAESLQFEIYNICSGVSRSGEEILELLKIPFCRSNLITEIDPARVRPNDVMDIFGTPERIQDELGWASHIPIDQTIEDFAAWRLAE